MATILLIEDDEKFSSALVRLLALKGHQVTTAGNGAEGIKRYRENPTDVILTDIFMPDEDGLGAILTLRGEDPGVRIIAMSGSSSCYPNWLKVAARLGARRTLEKPFTLRQLTAAIEEVFPTRSVLPGAAPG